MRVILPIFQEFPLQTTKNLDFTCFSEAVRIKLNSEGFVTKKRVRISESPMARLCGASSRLRRPDCFLWPTKGRGKLLNKKKAQRTLKWGCFAPDLIKLKNLRANMNSGRLTIDKEQLDNLTKRVYINVWWLLGFVEGEEHLVINTLFHIFK